MAATALDLVIDAGNRRSKLALFAGQVVLRQGIARNNNVADVRDFLGEDGADRVVVGSVAGDDPAFLDGLATIALVSVISGSSPSPLRIAYGSPSTLGVDRLANAVAASVLFPGRVVLAIDLGTCITYDVVDHEGAYLGGAISPGMHLRARAMHEHSARLPLIDPTALADRMGVNTEGSMRSGIQQGIRHELDGWITSLRYQFPHLAVVLTGGDAPWFARALKSGIFADPLLTLRGLHALLEYQSDPAGPDRRA